MPYKSDKIKLKGLQDRRRRLTDVQKAEIRHKYAKGGISHRGLAKQYGVSKSLIGIVVNPERAEKVKQYEKENWHKYYDRAKLTEATRNLRRYKQQLYLKGELKDER